MEFYEAVERRRTARQFLQKEVDFEAVKRILAAGNRAPTWDHNRSWRYILLSTDEKRAKGICNLIWLENLNLRGAFKAQILRYIAEKHPHLVPLYDEIYRRGSRAYWRALIRGARRSAVFASLSRALFINQKKS